MANIERINMADSSSAETGGTTTAVAANSANPPESQQGAITPEKVIPPATIGGYPVPEKPDYRVETIAPPPGLVQAENVTTPPGITQEPQDQEGQQRWELDGGIPPPEQPGQPEGPRGPEGPAGPEWETSPERGEWIMERIAFMETMLPYEVRYNAENGPVLNGLYDELIKYVDGLEENRYYRSSFNRREAHPEVVPEPNEPLIDAIIRSYKERAAKLTQLAIQEAQAPPEDFTGVESLDTLIQKYNSLNTLAAERPQIEADLLKYFREANRKGLLKGVDDRLNSIYLRYVGGSISASQASDLLHQATEVSAANTRPSAYITAEDEFRRRMGDPEVNPRLLNVWQPYLQWARARIGSLLNGETQADYREGEWRLPVEQTQAAIRETYWEPYAGYPDYYTISAKTPTQFIIAKESFLQMLRTHALGYAPDELIQNLINFKKVMSRDATLLAQQQEGLPDGPDKMTYEFAEEIRQEFEGEGFLWHIAYNIENYNKDGAKQGEMAMALHEGPQRWTRALRSRRGITGAHEFVLDNDLLVELAYNAQGSRGQLGRRSDIQNYFKSWIEGKVMERGMGIVLKDYDNRDVDAYSNPEFRYYRALLLDGIESQLRRSGNNLQALSKEDREEYIKSGKYLKENQERIGIYQSDEAFRSLYEGMEKDDNGFIKGDANLRNYQMFRLLPENQLPPRLRESVALGRIQQAIITFRTQAREGRVVLKKNEVLLDKLVDLNRISDQDRKLYKDAYDRSKASFELAMQMQVATREEAIRGGGVYFIYRNPYVNEYLKVRGSKDHELSPDERKKKWTKKQHIGWILDEIAKGTGVDALELEEKYLYYGLGEFDKNGGFKFKDQATEDQVRSMTIEDWKKLKAPADRENIVDNMPTHLAIKAVQAAVNWIKIRYRDDSDIWERADLTAYINAKDNKGKYRYPNFRAVFRDAMVEQTRNMAVEQIATNGFEAKFYYTDFRVTSFNVSEKEITIEALGGAQPMMLRQPTGEIDPQTGKMIVEDVEEVHLDFDKAINSYLALHTTHTYWAYQNNNTHTLVPKYIFEQARQIKDGRLRPEDADSLASLLIGLDPTLCRVKSFPGEQMGIEYIVFDAAVDESLMSWVDIKKALSQKFTAADGNPEYMQAGYYTEDKGGDSRYTLMVENLVAKMPKRFSRRFAAALGITPMYASTMADNLGRKGVIGAVSMMDDHIVNISGQRELSQFGLTKFINLMDSGNQLYFYLVGGIDPKTGFHHEGVFMKPTNNADKLVQLRERLASITQRAEAENEFFYALIETFGRVWDTLREIRKMYSDDRNAGGALDLRKMDVFLPDGRYNPAINTDINTGSSRHIARMFWDAYVNWLLDPGPGGGMEAYPSEVEFYKFLKQPYFYFGGRDGKGTAIWKRDGRTWSDWLSDKMAL